MNRINRQTNPKAIDLSRNELHNDLPFSVSDLIERNNINFSIYNTELRLEKALIEKYNCSKSEIHISNGVEDFLLSAFSRTIDGNLQLLLPKYSWGYYRVLSSKYGHEPRFYSVDDVSGLFKLDIDSLKENIISILSKGKRPLVIINNPSNPTGGFTNVRAVYEIVAEFPSALFIIDETYICFTDSDYNPTKFMRRFPNISVCRSMSKLYGISALRVGYTFIGHEFAKELKIFDNYLGNNILTDLIASECIRYDEVFLQKITKVIDLKNHTHRNLTHPTIANKIKAYQSKASFILCKTDPRTVEPMYDYLLGNQLIIKVFDRHDMPAGFFRVSISSKEHHMHQLTKLINKFVNDNYDNIRNI
ncbi:MAG TPA: aminotransferase class I/II-fold pyridoxal phosphate-dependent enzyme [Candidatus Saccharimonadales bacterium]|nr:aminotransferase class I/II-fold pyridoxal phosphate-dependent enzyme [Candidatus Saccharimonadales bacterium]